jgi:hypothetical protein
MAVVQSIQADLDGSRDIAIVEGTDDLHTMVFKDGAAIWDHVGWIDGWNRRPWDAFALAVDVDGDGAEEILILNNRDLWTGVMKWTAGALHVPWASPSPIQGPAGGWNRRADDVFSQDGYPGSNVVYVDHQADHWHGVLAWQSGNLVLVQLTNQTVTVPNVVGADVNSGKNEIAAALLTPIVDNRPTNAPPDWDPPIASTIPAAGSVVPMHSNVHILANLFG